LVSLATLPTPKIKARININRNADG
jgi:hypothetical protein